MGAAGFKGSWPPVFPDNGGLLFNTKDLVLSDGQSTEIFNPGMQYFTMIFWYNNIYLFRTEIVDF